MGAKKIPVNTPINTENRTRCFPISPEGFLPLENEIKKSNRNVVPMQVDYANGYLLGWHHHERVQLIYPSTGVIHLRTTDSIWVATPEKGVLIPAGTLHQVKMHGVVQMRSLFLHSQVLNHSPESCCF